MRTAALALAAACVTGPGGEPLALDVDYAVFVEDVQPVLSDRCANPACHGAQGRPLEVYAVHQHRLDPAEVFADTPLTPAELSLNFHRACGFLVDLERDDDCLLVRKPLAEAAGGVAHEGGDVWSDSSSPELQALRDWIEGAR